MHDAPRVSEPPGEAGTPDLRASGDEATVAPHIPAHVIPILDTLWSGGHAGYVVGGALRDALLGRPASDWDVATDARPDELLVLFPGAHYENRFGTVLVPVDAGHAVEVTTFRRDIEYRDRRRPDRVEFSDSLEEDLARRDFTVNALAYGRGGDLTPGAGPGDAAGTAGLRLAGALLRLVDPSGGRRDLAARVIRAVGDPAERFGEDALRLLRAVRLATQLDFEIEPATLAALRSAAPHAATVSPERVGQELRKMLAVPAPARGFRVLAQTGLLAPLFPLLARQVGLAQAKGPGVDLWEHTLRTLDAAARLAPGDETLAMAALFHDCGKPETWADGHFIGHESAGAHRAADLLRRMAVPRREAEPVVDLVRWHMFGYESRWTDAAVRRLIQKVGRATVPRLLTLREADNLGSGEPADAGGVDELRERIAAELERGVPLTIRDLAVDGLDLQEACDIPPGPILGAILDRILEAVIADPERNERETLLADVRSWIEDDAMLRAELAWARERRGRRGARRGTGVTTTATPTDASHRSSETENQ
jgi:tRNA nucleotidyltransferase (CCA-adding enzyme)